MLKTCFPFDKEEISAKVAIMRGVSQQELLDDWSRCAEEGSFIHSLAEKYVLGHKLKRKELKKIKHVIKFLKVNNPLKILTTELLIFSRKHNIAGMVDLVVQDTTNGKLYLLDYKTSRKEIDKDEDFERALPPLQNYPNNKFYKYSCQLSIYAYILKKEYGVDIFNNYLVHLKSDDTYELIEIEDMGMWCKEILSE